MHTLGKVNEDPGGKPEPAFHDGLEHRPIIRPTPKHKEQVQLTAHVRYPESLPIHLEVRRAMLQRALVVGTNGSSRNVGLDNGMLRASFGAETHAFPSMFVPAEHAAEAERNMESILTELQQEFPNLAFEGFVREASQTINRMCAEQAKKRQSLLHNIRTDSGEPLVELTHEAAAGNGEPREDDRDGVGARAARA